MPLSLHEATVPGWLQITQAVEGLVDKAESWAAENNLDPSEVIGARLAEDMLPFSYQVKSVWTHSVYAIARVQEGVFQPERTPPPDSFVGLREVLATTRTELEALNPSLLDSIAGDEVIFSVGDAIRMEFTVQNFLLSFSQPNLFFHATTAYDILRMQGVALGKLDYLGKLPVNS